MEKKAPKQGDVLKSIADDVAIRLGDEMKKRPLAELEQSVAKLKVSPRDFTAAIKNPQLDYPIIAEIKKASPSKGDIAPDVDPVAVAVDYARHGAAALSVLTEPRFFKGSIEYLRQIHKALPDIPLLMKDFFIDEYQIYQAREAGADAILLIAALLGEKRSRELMHKAKSLGLTTLYEVHTADELAMAAQIEAPLIGINSRNLKTMDLSLENIFKLLPLAPRGSILIAESGIRSHNDLKTLKAAGCHGFLVGTHLMATGQAGPALAKLLEPM